MLTNFLGHYFPILLLFIYFSGNDWLGQEDGCSCARPSCHLRADVTHSTYGTAVSIAPYEVKNTSERPSWSALVQVIHQHHRWRHSTSAAHWRSSLLDEYLRGGWPLHSSSRTQTSTNQYSGRLQAAPSTSDYFSFRQVHRTISQKELLRCYINTLTGGMLKSTVVSVTMSDFSNPFAVQEWHRRRS